jgi:2-amino-4-hydroxy-6-hydroxymethyldihydropteridine diphosphokinase
MPVCLIGLGSNQGDRRANLEAAAARLAANPQVDVLARSNWHETAPVGGPAGQPDFLNGALVLDTALGPHELLAVLQQIERQLGRRPAERWGPRPIDLDLLLYGDLVLDTPELLVPHPRLAYRRFVLGPASEVAPEMLHPTIHWTIARLLEHLDTSPRYVAVTGPIAAGKTQLAGRLAAALGCRAIVEQPDWAQLDAFYADPAGNAWETELGFLAQRARLLAAEVIVGGDSCRRCDGVSCMDRRRKSPPTSSVWQVSDFWFEQSAAFARAWLPPGRLAAFLEEFERLRQTAPQPRLIVFLDAPAAELLARVGRRGRDCERRLTAEQLQRIRQSVIEQARLPERGPVLRPDGDHPDAVFADALATVQGME